MQSVVGIVDGGQECCRSGITVLMQRDVNVSNMDEDENWSICASLFCASEGFGSTMHSERLSESNSQVRDGGHLAPNTET